MNAEHLFKCLASDDNKHALMCLIWFVLWSQVLLSFYVQNRNELEVRLSKCVSTILHSLAPLLWRQKVERFKIQDISSFWRRRCPCFCVTLGHRGTPCHVFTGHITPDCVTRDTTHHTHLTFVLHEEGVVYRAVREHLHPADLRHVVRRHAHAQHLAVPGARVPRGRDVLAAGVLPADHVNLAQHKPLTLKFEYCKSKSFIVAFYSLGVRFYTF